MYKRVEYLSTIPILVNPKTEPQTDNKHSIDTLNNEQQPIMGGIEEEWFEEEKWQEAL